MSSSVAERTACPSCGRSVLINPNGGLRRHEDTHGDKCDGTRPAVIAIPLPWTRPPLRANDRRNWRVQWRDFQQALLEARWAIRAAKVDPIGGVAEACLHWRKPTRSHADPDGIAPTQKAVLDALVKEGVLPDDQSRYVRRTAQEIHEPQRGLPAAVWIELTGVVRLEGVA